MKRAVLHCCPVCNEPFKADDACAADIELGTCHAACLEGSPVVDLDTGEPSDGPIATYQYDEDTPHSTIGVRILRLTRAQSLLLVDASDECGTFCVHSYRPGLRLVALGLAEWEDGKPSSDWLNITPAGRLALSQQGKPAIGGDK